MARAYDEEVNVPMAKERTLAQRVLDLEKGMSAVDDRVTKLENDNESHGIRLDRVEREIGLL